MNNNILAVTKETSFHYFRNYYSTNLVIKVNSSLLKSFSNILLAKL